MPVQIKKLPDEPITLITVTESIDQGIMLPGPEETDRQIMEIVAETPGIDYLIVDISSVELSFSELVAVLGDARQEIKALGGRAFVEANMRYLFVGSGELAELAVKALRQEQYGSIDTMLFRSVQEALTYARAEIQRSKK